MKYFIKIKSKGRIVKKRVNIKVAEKYGTRVLPFSGDRIYGIKVKTAKEEPATPSSYELRMIEEMHQ